MVGGGITFLLFSLFSGGGKNFGEALLNVMKVILWLGTLLMAIPLGIADLMVNASRPPESSG
jgi:NhaP-type Na+/H+ or K+/H+ antiporter